MTAAGERDQEPSRHDANTVLIHCHAPEVGCDGWNILAAYGLSSLAILEGVLIIRGEAGADCPVTAR